MNLFARYLREPEEEVQPTTSVQAQPADGDAKDAARYRWIRNNGTASVSLALSIDEEGNKYGSSWEQIPEVLDAAIDAAIASKWTQP
jgi:hypothetical protein